MITLRPFSIAMKMQFSAMHDEGALEILGGNDASHGDLRAARAHE
jgi:hypothetical protein